jgi:cytidylate kinase
MVIAIDGPAGAGKSTVARALALRLQYSYLDSGAMYRCVALEALRRGAGSLREAPGGLPELATGLAIQAGERVVCDGRDVTDAIRAPAVSEMASRVAADPGVRAAMVATQRAVMADGDWVAEGRDIGTVVAPDAELKIFLTAGAQARAQRRARELGGDAAVVLAEQALRDARDATREHSPLRPAADAVELDTTDLDVDAVVSAIVALVRTRTRTRTR